MVDQSGNAYCLYPATDVTRSITSDSETLSAANASHCLTFTCKTRLHHMQLQCPCTHQNLLFALPAQRNSPLLHCRTIHYGCRGQEAQD